MTGDFNRKSAFAIKIVDPDTGKPPEGQPRLIQLDDSMFVFFGDSIFQIFPPELIDPENTAPDTRPAYQKVYALGSNNSWIARSIIQAHEMLKSSILREGLDQNAILSQVWQCTKLLLKCEAAHYEVYAQTMEKMRECDEVIEKNKSSGFIPSLPQVDGLEDEVLSFFNHAKKLLIETHKLISLFFGAPEVGSNFPKLRKWLSENYPQEQYIVPMLESDAPWIDVIRHCRNAVEHPKLHFKVEISNFRLHPGNKCSGPSWRYDLSAEKAPTQAAFTDIVLDFGVYSQNLLTFLEETFLLCLKSNWVKTYSFEIFKRTPEQISKECPIVYYVGSALETGKIVR